MNWTSLSAAEVAQRQQQQQQQQKNTRTWRPKPVETDRNKQRGGGGQRAKEGKKWKKVRKKERKVGRKKGKLAKRLLSPSLWGVRSVGWPTWLFLLPFAFRWGRSESRRRRWKGKRRRHNGAVVLDRNGRTPIVSPFLAPFSSARPCRRRH